MDVVNLAQAKPFITKDGSEIRELLAHRNSCIRNQSLAEARIAPGMTTEAHHHPLTEEIYYIVSGVGDMVIGEEVRRVVPGDAIAIPPVLFTKLPIQVTKCCGCCVAVPGYEHDDTIIDDSRQNDSSQKGA